MENHILGRTGPSSLKRAASRLSESKHVSLVLVRLKLASGSLKRTGKIHYPGRLSLKRRESRLSDANDESLVFTRSWFARGSLKRAAKIQTGRGKLLLA